ncbi:MAG: DegQ family serine endoprotease [Zetaproteobacteria bacterium]|nr:MAG: DegQ family serine endoprotease [Zetaproteobacteria bacterium]
MLFVPVAHALPDSFADLAESQADAVVNISTTKIVRGGHPGVPPGFGFPPGSPFDEFFKDFFQNMPPQERHALGTGFIISSDGYIVTNNHVVDSADEIIVKTRDGQERKAKVIGTDPKLDVALLKINAHHLKRVRLGDSDKLRVGDWVVAIGNPFGLEQTVTAGIVSAKGRVIGSGPYDDFIQTDAAINPGNSGGPLFNVKGEVVGINTAIYSRSGGNNGIGFAIPINLARSVIEELKKTGHVTRARLGVYITDVDKETQKALNLPNRHGALVPQVESGSAADKAGIRAGDVIVALDGELIKNAHDLPIRVARHKPGDRVKVRVIRNGKPKEIVVTVEAMPEDHAARGAAQQRVRLGIEVEDLTPQLAERLNVHVRHGVVVRRVLPGSPASRAGIRAGDVIFRINGQLIKHTAAFRRLLAGFKPGEVLRVMLDRHGDEAFALIRLPEKPQR